MPQPSSGAPSPSARRRVPLDRVEDSRAEALDAPRSGGPSLVGEGDLDYLCPGCCRVLCQGIAPGDLAGVTLRCTCGTLGRIRDAGAPGPEPARQAVDHWR